MAGGRTVLVVTYTDGASETYQLGDGPGMAESWRVSRDHVGVPELVIGSGLPRVHIPLCNVRNWMLLEHPDAQAEDSSQESWGKTRCWDVDEWPVVFPKLVVDLGWASSVEDARVLIGEGLVKFSENRGATPRTTTSWWGAVDRGTLAGTYLRFGSDVVYIEARRHERPAAGPGCAKAARQSATGASS